MINYFTYAAGRVPQNISEIDGTHERFEFKGPIDRISAYAEAEEWVQEFFDTYQFTTYYIVEIHGRKLVNNNLKRIGK